ncbi:hypothetical protein [Streptomyces sp. NPDC004685]
MHVGSRPSGPAGALTAATAAAALPAVTQPATQPGSPDKLLQVNNP